MAVPPGTSKLSDSVSRVSSGSPETLLNCIKCLVLSQIPPFPPSPFCPTPRTSVLHPTLTWADWSRGDGISYAVPVAATRNWLSSTCPSKPKKLYEAKHHPIINTGTQNESILDVSQRAKRTVPCIIHAYFSARFSPSTPACKRTFFSFQTYIVQNNSLLAKKA